MRVINKSPLLLYLSVVSFYISSMAVAFMPLGSFTSGEGLRMFTYALAAAFWLGIISGTVCMLIITKRRRWDKKHKDPYGGRSTMLRIFVNKPSAVFDILFGVGVLTIAATLVIRPLPGWLAWEAIFLTLLSFEMHCIFSSKNYRWLQSGKKEAPKKGTVIEVYGASNS